MMWVKWKLVLVYLEIVLIWAGDRCIPQAQKSPSTHPMVLLCDMGQVEGCFGPFGDSVNLNARKVLGLHRMYQGHENLLGHT